MIYSHLFKVSRSASLVLMLISINEWTIEWTDKTHHWVHWGEIPSIGDLDLIQCVEFACSACNSANFSPVHWFAPTSQRLVGRLAKFKTVNSRYCRLLIRKLGQRRGKEWCWCAVKRDKIQENKWENVIALRASIEVITWNMKKTS